jgi:hypothetical protein
MASLHEDNFFRRPFLLDPEARDLDNGKVVRINFGGGTSSPWLAALMVDDWLSRRRRAAIAERVVSGAEMPGHLIQTVAA